MPKQQGMPGEREAPLQGPTVVSHVAWGALPLGNGPFVQPLVARLIAILSAGAVTLHQSAFIAE
jgi:hypothetical protein